MASTAQEEAFLDEVLGLFVLEAQEWINQSNTALLELEHHPVSDRKQKLYDTIVCGVTNLGGSAATVELHDLEELAFGLLPLLKVMQSINDSATSDQLGALREGFNGIIGAVQALSETKIGRIPHIEQILKRLTEVATQTIIAPQQGTPASSCTSIPSFSFIDRLTEFQRQHAGTSSATRHTIEAIIRRAKTDYGERGWRSVDAATVIQIVQDLDRGDDEFMNDVKKRLPTIVGIFADCASPNADMLLSNGRLERLLQEVQAIHDSARALDAKPVMQFFHGLHTFLTILSQKTVEISVGRLETVESRIKRIVPIAEQWIEDGKKERAVIQQFVKQ